MALFLKLPFDLESWQGIAEQEFPAGLPHHTPTIQLSGFSKATSSSNRPLQVAVARMLGFRWPDKPGKLTLIHLGTKMALFVSRLYVGKRLPPSDCLKSSVPLLAEKWSDAPSDQLLSEAGCKPGLLSTTGSVTNSSTQHFSGFRIAHLSGTSGTDARTASRAW